MDRPNFEDSTADGAYESPDRESTLGEAQFGADDGEIVGAVTGAGTSVGTVFGTHFDKEESEDDPA